MIKLIDFIENEKRRKNFFDYMRKIDEHIAKINKNQRSYPYINTLELARVMDAYNNLNTSAERHLNDSIYGSYGLGYAYVDSSGTTFPTPRRCYARTVDNMTVNPRTYRTTTTANLHTIRPNHDVQE